MTRGFLSGAMMGTVVSLGVAGVASVVSEGPVAPNVTDAAPIGVTAEAGATLTGVDAAKTDADLVQDGVSSVYQSVQDNVASVAQAGSDLSQLPQTGEAERLQTPEVTADIGSVIVDNETPVLPSPQGAEPIAPESETELSISTLPAQPPAPQVPKEETAFEEVPTETGTSDEVIAAVQPVEPEQIEEPVQPQVPVVEGEVSSLRLSSESNQEDTRPKIGRPAGSLVDRETEVEKVADIDAPTDDTSTIPPLKAFAVPFESADDKPLMSIVLIDAGADLSETTVGLPALRSFPAPVSFAVDASLPDAVERMKMYRAKGFEVLAMIDLPSGATAMDAETVLNAVLSQMTEVVGVLEGVGTGMQEVREASDQATQILLETGHGFVTQSNGLNTVAKLAEREGVPTATVFRDFDSADQTPTVIRRFLDQAAFRAGQEGGVIMLGRLRPDTISALLLWGLQDRASRVALAPVSALLSK